MASYLRGRLEIEESYQGNLLIAVFSNTEYIDEDWRNYTKEGILPPEFYSYPMCAYGGFCFRPQTWIILPDLPFVHQYVAEYTQFTQSMLGKPPQIKPIYIPVKNYQGEVLDEIVSANIQSVTNQLQPGEIKVITHAVAPETLEWIGKLKSVGINAQPAHPTKEYFALSGINFNDRTGFSELARKYDLPVPNWQVIFGANEIAEKYAQLGSSSAFAKVAAGGGGFGVKLVKNLAELQSTYNDWVSDGTIAKLYGAVLTPVELQQPINGIIDLLSFQYNTDLSTGTKFVTTSKAPGLNYAVTSQLTNGTHWIGNTFNQKLNLGSWTISAELLITKLQRKFSDVINLYPQLNAARGGIDFALFEVAKAPELAMAVGSEWLDGEIGIAIIEHNGGRQSYADQSQSIVDHLTGKHTDSFVVRKVVPKVSLSKLWNSCLQLHIAYDPKTESGVLPVDWVYSPENKYAFIGLFGQNQEITKQLATLQQSKLIAEN